MSVVVGLLVLGCLVVWMRRRFGRRSELAGRIAEKPVFTLEPPRRRMGSRKGERL